MKSLACATLKQGKPHRFLPKMNIKNALGFLVLGTLMYVSSVLAQSAEPHQTAVVNASVRTVWLEFMGWVTGGIGFAYLGREATLRLPALLAMLLPERLLRPVEARSEPERLPVGVRVAVSR